MFFQIALLRPAPAGPAPPSGYLGEEIGGWRRDQGDAERFQEIVPRELYRQVAGDQSGLSTMMHRTPLPAIRSSMALLCRALLPKNRSPASALRSWHAATSRRQLAARLPCRRDRTHRLPLPRAAPSTM